MMNFLIVDVSQNVAVVVHQMFYFDNFSISSTVLTVQNTERKLKKLGLTILFNIRAGLHYLAQMLFALVFVPDHAVILQWYEVHRMDEGSAEHEEAEVGPAKLV
jgi:hypothetical protein